MHAPTISGFEIIKKIGQGGMATVWMARQISLDRIVAIKVLLPRFAVAAEEVARFRSEAQAAARLKHPGVVQVFDASVADGSYYFVMEYIAGYTVGDWVRRKGALAERDALLVAEHVCDALGYAWEHARIIHCDIKPDNILIDEDGTVKVADLGLARTLTAMAGDDIDEDHVLGTPSYMSPEQARGDAHLDFRSDIYALGATLYHMLTGHRLFEEEDDDTVLQLQISGSVPDPMINCSGLSKPLCWLLERMLAKEPARRGDSWHAVMADMRRVYSGLMPHGSLHHDDLSTIERSPTRSTIDHPRLERLQVVPKSSSNAVWTALWTAVVAIAIAVGLKLYLTFSAAPIAPPPARTTSSAGTRPGTPTPPPARVADPARENISSLRGKILFDDAVAWQSANPDLIAEGIARFQKVVDTAPDTDYATEANARIRSIKSRGLQLRKTRIEKLQTDLNALKEAGDYPRAEALINAFGEATPEDNTFRQRMLQDVNWHREAVESQKRLQDRKQQEQRCREIMAPSLTAMASSVLKGNTPDAIASVQILIENPDLELFHSNLTDLKTALENLNNLDYWIMVSFQEQQGQTIEVMLQSGPVSLTVGDIGENSVSCVLHTEGGDRDMRLAMSDLAPRERFARMAFANNDAAALARGLMAFEAGAYSKAADFFAGTHFLLSDILSQAAKARNP